jgi:hypothetical protein
VRFPDRQAAAFYLAALIDGEGHVGYHRYTSPRPAVHRYVLVVNTDKGIIDACEEAMTMLGLDFRSHDRKTLKGRTLYERRVTGRANLETILREVPLQAERKRDTLALAISTYERGYTRRKITVPAVA